MPRRLVFLLCCVALAEGIHAQNCASQAQAEMVPAPIRWITFSNDGLLTPDREQEFDQSAREQKVDPVTLVRGINSVADELAERVRRAYQDEGYFKAEVSAQVLKTVADDRLYDLEVQVRDAGPQYRLGEIGFVHEAAFSGTQLRALFPIQRGEIFSREKIMQGLEGLRKLYLAHGHINYVSVPDTRFDDQNWTANLTLNVDEGKQFRLHSVEVLGVDAETKARVLSEVTNHPGDTYVQQDWDDLLAKFPDLVTKREPETIDKRLDERNARVDVLLDFRKPAPCPKPQLICTFTGSQGHCRPAAGQSLP